MGQLPSPAQKAAQARLMAVIRKAAPEAEPVTSYGVAAVRLNGPLVAVGASKTHCSFYVMSTSVMQDFAEELDALGFRYSKGTIQFLPDNPPPDALVTRIVKARVAQNAAMKTVSAAKARARKKGS